MNKAVINFINKMVSELESEEGDREALRKKYQELIQDGTLTPEDLEELNDPLFDIKDIDLYLEMNRLPDPTPKDLDDLRRYFENDLTEDEIEDLWDRMFANTKLYDDYEMRKLSYFVKNGREPALLPKKTD
ncbi:MAG: hypothetical protein JJU41_11500 [Bacteroidetes bacterium]|nr:hypothetical protein [Bacteroidota bacterium]